MRLAKTDGQDSTEHPRIALHVFRCPNRKCQGFSLTALYSEHSKHKDPNTGRTREDYRTIATWSLPQNSGKTWPPEIEVPAQIMADYREAKLVSSLSPKASATLARRCLQGMIRDFWSVTGSTLFDEISILKTKLNDDELWNAIDAIRKVGNIGAHMEKDVDVIIEVDEGEAETLLELVELLIDEWYVASHNRAKTIEAAGKLGDEMIERRGKGTA